MPKEYINSRDFGREAILYEDGGDGAKSPKTEVLDTKAACVVWSRESDQVEVRILDRVSDPDGFDGMNVNLDRNGINRLIRFLRRARDDAFGRDE